MLTDRPKLPSWFGLNLPAAECSRYLALVNAVEWGAWIGLAATLAWLADDRHDLLLTLLQEHRWPASEVHLLSRLTDFLVLEAGLILGMHLLRHWLARRLAACSRSGA